MAINFFYGRVSPDTGTAIIFISVGILPIFRSSEELAWDVTISTLPFLFAQLFTIRGFAYRYVCSVYFLY
jgi:hypothetical protein